MSFSFDDPLLKMAAILFAGIIGGELVAMIKLPKVTGWIGTGIILTALPLAFLDAEEVSIFSPYMNFVLGYIAFTVGAALHFASLKNAAKRLGLLLLGEAIVTPLIAITALIWLGGLELRSAIVLGAVAICGAPGTTVLVVQEARARGILTRTLIAAVALIDMVAVGVFTFVMAFLPAPGHGIEVANLGPASLSVGIELGLAAAVGFGAAVFALALTRTIVGPAFVGPSMVGVILGAWGAAVGFGVSGILACTFAGIAVTNLRHDTVRSTEAYLHSIGGVLFAGFFTLAGMRLDFSQVIVPATAFLVVVFFASRLIGKSLSAFLAMTVAQVPSRVRNYLGLALLPHGGVAVGLILLVQADERLADIAPTVTTVGLAALAINQLLGPSATRFSLVRSGEAGKDRARLLDFLDEQHIVVDLESDSKEGLVKELTNRLYAVTPDMPLDQDQFFERVMQRELEATTCLGEGLMIPHAILEEGDLTGVLGISKKGLHLPTPDKMPVHAVLLLATPETDRKRHLEVLSAFAKAITRDVHLREQLYHARTAAHAYDVLHAEEAEDINYFLEDAFEKAGVREDV